ncbi:MAG TPA: UDP-N-acetylmuramate--L-alanine ligase [Acidimicrobiia bacterium]
MRLDSDRIHLVGAGGAGMSAIARVLIGMGHHVSGSDLRGGSTLDRLADVGVETHTGHHPEVVASADLVVASSAVPDDDPELAAASTAGISIWRRPRLLEEMTHLWPTIGATGTHGKTTTTALLITALRAAGVDPSFIVGGDLADLGTNGHYGTDPLLVLEADEAFRTFESLALVGLVVTNVEPEHVEHFGSSEELLETFVGVAASVEGPVVACLDDDGSAEVARRVGAVTYGLDPAAMWRITDFTPAAGGSRFTLSGPGRSAEVQLRRPGLHNARNAAGALALLSTLGYDLQACVHGLGEFHGVGRRWEHRGVVAGVTLIDDYAHHPTEVAATLSASAGVVPGRVWAVFQPHLYSRTERLQDEFGEALSAADVVVVTDVYGSREEPVPGITGELVAEAVGRRGGEVHYVAHKADLARFLVDRVSEGDLVLTMGAGDITLLPSELASMLAGQR